MEKKVEKKERGYIKGGSLKGCFANGF